MTPIWVSASVEVADELPPAVDAMFDRGEWHQGQFPENPRLSRGMAQHYMGAFRAFLPKELRSLVQAEGMRIPRCTALGSLASLCGEETVDRIMQNEELFQPFLDLCERFDTEIMPSGPGTRQRAGLIAVAVPAS